MASKGDGGRGSHGRAGCAEPAQTSQTGQAAAIKPQSANANANATSKSRSASRDSSPVTIRHASSSTSIPALRKQPSANLYTSHFAPPNTSNVATTSTTNSPHTSRNTSPIRPSRSGLTGTAYDPTQQQSVPPTGGATAAAAAAAAAQAPTATGTASSARPTAPALKSRQSSQDASPHRPAALSTPTGTVPSAAAIQRALSATSVPQLQAGGPVTEAVSKLPKMQQRPGANSGESTPVWPQSPRIKSPPPGMRSRRNSSLSQRSIVAPSIQVQNSTPTGSITSPTGVAGESAKSPETNPAKGGEARKEEQTQQQQSQQQLQPSTSGKAPSRGPSGPRPMLETVEENTPPNGLVPQVQAQTTPQPAKPVTRTSDDDKPLSAARGKPSGYLSDANSRLAESESDANLSGDNKPRQSSQDLQKNINRQKAASGARTSYPALSSAKSRQPEGTRNMTVETETVASVPQTSIGGGSNASNSGRLEGGSLRMKPSTETIRPRKDRKRVSRKAPSINNGTASSKADIFEARVATQVDEQGSSSDETFVYESNTEPPERRRHHSRTPSGASLHSQSEFRHGIRNYGGISGDHRVAGKRSMKFSNNPYPYNFVDSPAEDGNGTVRAHARHIGRLGRTGGSGSRTSLYGQDSPFTQASRVRNGEMQTSRPGSPKSMTSTQHRPSSLLFGRKNDLDLEGGEGDDERTPLTGTVRTPRSTRLHGRRFGPESIRSGSYRGHAESVYDQSHSFDSRSSSSSRMSRFGGCLFGLVVFILVVLGAVGFLVMSNKPLYCFEVDRIENVLASEQEIMLDLLVGAVNPNVLAITVSEMDLNIFAKSKYVSPIGGGHVLESRDLQDPNGHWGHDHPPGEDEGNDPIEGDSQTMLLGRIFHFDSPLTFDGSPVKRHPHHSMGELRLARPGNKTEMGGSERWERVLQYPFELILRGVLKYQLPVSSRMQSAAIGATVYVHPEEGIIGGSMRVEVPDESEKWEWIELGDVEAENGKGESHSLEHGAELSEEGEEGDMVALVKRKETRGKRKRQMQLSTLEAVVE